jgi:hypothetical protein
MRRRTPYKYLLPVLQSLLAIALWLYIPVQYRKELLEWYHQPSDHPFRARVETRRQYFPPACEQLLQLINFPAYAASEAIVRPLLDHIEYSRHAAFPSWFPDWRFTLPVNDPEALPPREIFYAVHFGELMFLGLVALQWFWIGWRIDRYLRERKGAQKQRPRAIRRAGIAAVATVLLCSAGFACWLIPNARSPHARRVGVFGLIWPAAMLAYISLSIQAERQMDSRRTQ